MTSLDWLLAIGLTFFVLCSLAGMVKFVQAIRILKRGRPVIDPAVALEQEREFQNISDEKS